MLLNPLWESDFPTDGTLPQWCRRQVVPGIQSSR
jgi:hypothetical protein